MSPELEDKLRGIFPYRLSYIKRYHGICECDDGWYDIIFRMLRDLESLDETAPIHYRIGYIKEKFGELRVGLHVSSSKEQGARITQATEEADKTCELCGEEGMHRYPDFHKVLCDDCIPKWKEKLYH